MIVVSRWAGRNFQLLLPDRLGFGHLSLDHSIDRVNCLLQLTAKLRELIDARHGSLQAYRELAIRAKSSTALDISPRASSHSPLLA
jgi:hypothetical protein